MNKFITIILVFAAFLQSTNAQFTQELARTYNGSGDFSDRFTCLTRDAAGNVYVGGSSVITDNSRDFLVAKYNNQGVLQWLKTLDGTGNGADEATAITVDAAGNVYATGYQKGVNAGNDFLTVKYNATGVLQWSQIYNSLYNEVDQGNSIAVDAAGDVLVAGQSDRDSTTTANDDYVTIKYSGATGAQVWLQRYNGAGNNIDRAAKVLCDATNNVYVTGRSSNGGNEDYVTIKYNSAGVQQWLKIEDRSGNDRATDMCFDPSGNIIVTGRSKVNNYDYYTVKYSAAGVKAWGIAYNNLDDDRATCVTTDAAGNVYVGGQSDTNANTTTNIYDFRVVKYSPTGTQVWTTAYSSVATDDIPYSIATDGSKVVLGGETANAAGIKDMLIAEFDATSGANDFHAVYNGAANKSDAANAIVTDAAGTIFAAGYTENAQAQRDAALVRWNTTGTQLGATIYNGAGDNSDNVRAMYVEAATGNTYLAGYSINTGTDRNFKITKINTVGDTVWTRTLNGTSSWSSDEAVAITADAAGNIYATGWTKNSTVGYDMTVVKYSAAGVLAWTVNFDNGLRQNDRGTAIAIAPNGNVIVVGKTDINATNATNDDLLLVALDAINGGIIWKKTYSGTTLGSDRATHLKVSATGNIYVAGKTWNGTNDDVVLQKYNSAGVFQWTKIYAASANIATINDVQLDASENVYIAATTDVPSVSYHLLKYNSAGVQQWVKTNTVNSFNSLVIDAAGNIYAVGNTDGSLISTIIDIDYSVVKYNAAGVQQFVKLYDMSGENDDAVKAELDANGYLVITGQSFAIPNSGFERISTILVDATGTLRESVNYDNPLADSPACMAIANGKVYIGGYVSPSINEKDQLLLRYGYIVATDNQNNGTGNTTTVFPNPCTNYFTIENTLFTENTVKSIELCDLLGRKIPVVATQRGTAITVEMPNDLPNGNYILFSQERSFAPVKIAKLSNQ